MSVTTIKSFPASSYKTIPMQENNAYSGERHSGTADEKKTNNKKEKAVWEDALSVSLYTSEDTAKRSVGTSSYTKIRHMVYKQNMLERRAELLKNSKASVLENVTAETEAVEKNATVDAKQQKLMEKAVKKYVVSESYVRLPDAVGQSDGTNGVGSITALFGNYNVDKTYRMQLTTVDVQC